MTTKIHRHITFIPLHTEGATTMASNVSINVDPNDKAAVRAALPQILGLPPDASDEAITSAVADLLGTFAPGAGPLPPLPAETVAQLARYHGLSEREIRTCREVGAPIAAYRKLRDQQRAARARASGGGR